MPIYIQPKLIMKMRWQTIASNVSIRTISPTATPLPKAYGCVAVYIGGRRTNLVVYGWRPKPPTKKTPPYLILKVCLLWVLEKNMIELLNELFFCAHMQMGYYKRDIAILTIIELHMI